jgi:hypothetical protein
MRRIADSLTGATDALAPNVHGFNRYGRSLFRPVSVALITEV